MFKEIIKNYFSEGARVKLIFTNDPYTELVPGDRGTVSFVDDMGTIFVDWDNGSKLGIIYGIDKIELIKQ